MIEIRSLGAATLNFFVQFLHCPFRCNTPRGIVTCIQLEPYRYGHVQNIVRFDGRWASIPLHSGNSASSLLYSNCACCHTTPRDLNSWRSIWKNSRRECSRSRISIFLGTFRTRQNKACISVLETTGLFRSLKSISATRVVFPCTLTRVVKKKDG